VRIDLQLFVIGSWDGNGGLGAGPDLIDIQVPVIGTLLHSSFYNCTENGSESVPMQSFPDSYPFGFHKGYTGAARVRSLAFVQRYPRDAVYPIQYTFAHDGADLEIVVSGLTVPQDDVKELSEDETWGIGGLTISTD